MAKPWYIKAKAQIRSRGILQKNLADSLSISEGTMTNWLTGKYQPPLGKLRELSDLIGISYADMMLDDDSLARDQNELDMLRSLRNIPDDQKEHALALVKAILATLQKPTSEKE